MKLLYCQGSPEKFASSFPSTSDEGLGVPAYFRSLEMMMLVLIGDDYVAVVYHSGKFVGYTGRLFTGKNGLRKA